MIKNIKNKVGQNFYDICVNFTYEYGKKVLKNSKIYFYIKTQNIDKCVEELEKYKTFQSVFEPKMVKRRDFDIHVLKNNIYKKKEIYDYIATIDDSLMRQIIMYRCLSLCTWEEVAIYVGGGNSADSVRKLFVRFVRWVCAIMIL